MKTKLQWLQNAAIVALLPSTLVFVASCASEKHDLSSGAQTYQQEGGGYGFGGQTYSTSVTATSTVVSVDAAQRTLELRQADGTVTTYKAGPEVVNFDQIKSGNRVKTTFAEQRTVGFAVATAALSDNDKTDLVHSLNGGPVMAVNTRTGTAKVLSISYWDHTVTVEMADGKTLTVTANPNTNLAAFNPGDKVSVQVVQTRTFTVEKP